MKKMTAKKVIVFSLAVAFISGVVPASAFTRLVKGSEGMGRASVNELADKELAVLPGNPFFFVIGMSSNIKGFFISDRLSEAAFKLEVAGRRAGEVRKLLDWASDNEELLSVSLVNYKNALSDFETKLSGLSPADLGEDANKELNTMVARLFTQLRFVDDARDSFSSSEDLATLQQIDAILVSTLRFIGSELDSAEQFTGRVVSHVSENSNAATAVRVVQILARLIQEVAGDDSAAIFTSAIAGAREELIAALAQAIADEQPSTTALMKVAAIAPAPVTPTVSEIVDRLADETLKAEIAAILQQ